MVRAAGRRRGWRVWWGGARDARGRMVRAVRTVAGMSAVADEGGGRFVRGGVVLEGWGVNVVAVLMHRVLIFSKKEGCVRSIGLLLSPPIFLV